MSHQTDTSYPLTAGTHCDHAYRVGRSQCDASDVDRRLPRCRAYLPIPSYVRSEPALVAPYLTAGNKLLRILSRASLGTEMILLLEDCHTLEVARRTRSELADDARSLSAWAAHS
jgi:hypothetical protein